MAERTASSPLSDRSLSSPRDRGVSPRANVLGSDVRELPIDEQKGSRKLCQAQLLPLGASMGRCDLFAVPGKRLADASGDDLTTPTRKHLGLANTRPCGSLGLRGVRRGLADPSKVDFDAPGVSALAEGRHLPSPLA